VNQLLFEYLRKVLPREARLEEYPIEAFVDAASLGVVRALRGASLYSTIPIARVFVIRDLPVGTELGELKGFLVPLQINWRSSFLSGGRTGFTRPGQGISYIFISDRPEDLTDTHKFHVCHELGHTTKHAQRVAGRPYEGPAAVLLLFLWILLTGGAGVFLVVLPVIGYMLVRLSLDLSPKRWVFDDEAVADTIGVRLLPNSVPLDVVERRLTSTLRKNPRLLGIKWTESRAQRLEQHFADRRQGKAPIPLSAMPDPWRMILGGFAVLLAGWNMSPLTGLSLLLLGGLYLITYCWYNSLGRNLVVSYDCCRFSDPGAALFVGSKPGYLSHSPSDQT
jgi:hypothetical protein